MNYVVNIISETKTSNIQLIILSVVTRKNKF